MLIVTYNIQYGLGRDDRFDLPRIAREVADADVIGLQEVERHWARSGGVDQVSELARLLPGHRWVFGANLDMDSGWPERDEGQPHRRRQFGNMLLSRWPIVSTRNFPLPKFGTVRDHSINRGLLEAVIAPPKARAVRIYTTHLCHLATATRLPQLRFVLDRIAHAPAEGGAWSGSHPTPTAGWLEGGLPPMPREAILMGDMNFRPGSAEYDLIAGPTDGNGRRVWPLEGLIDAQLAAGAAESDNPTHPNGGRIDHIFITASLAGAVRRMRVDTAATGSDHWPVWLELAIEDDRH
jgi:endonuclease/exonuclease/phosphatase family metal-dependent hydrolase